MSSVRCGEPVVVAVDGPSGVGKSTTARRIAGLLGLPYLDTGSMYRAFGSRVLEAGVDPGDEAAVLELLQATDIGLDFDGQVLAVLLDGSPVEGRIRSRQVGEVTSVISAYSGVRQLLVSLQRRFGGELGGVFEGRDIGSVVFPGTPFKFFLDAPTPVRVERRYRQLREQEREVARPEVEAELEERDRRDRQRQDSPLRADDSYRVIDTSVLSQQEVVERIVELVRAGMEVDDRRCRRSNRLDPGPERNAPR